MEPGGPFPFPVRQIQPKPAPPERLVCRILVAVADDWGEDATRRAKAALISTSVPSAARVVDYMNGGQVHAIVAGKP